MALIVIKVISCAFLIGVILAAPSGSPELQKQVLEKWFREFQEISATFDKDVLTKFAAEKGFHAKGRPSSSSTTSTSTTTSTTPKPNPIAVTLTSGLEQEEDGLSPFFPSSQVSFGPVRIRYVMRTSSFPFSQMSDLTSMEESQATGTVKKDNPIDHGLEDMTMSRMLRKLILNDEEDDGPDGTIPSDSMEMIGALKPLEDGIRGGSPSHGVPALDSQIKVDTQEWLSELLGGPPAEFQPSSSSSTSTTTTTTTSTTPAPTTEAAMAAEPEHKNWNPFTKQGFQRIFRFAF